MKKEGMVEARNSAAFALGVQCLNGFKVRRVVWGKLLAKYERREGEEIRRAAIFVAPAKKPKSKKGKA